MTLPAPGNPIPFGGIQTEFGGTNPISLSEYYRDGGTGYVIPGPANNNIPASGQVSMSNFYGSQKRYNVPITISANTTNYDLYTNRGPSYVAGVSNITLTINPGVYIGSTSVPGYGLSVPSAFSPTDEVTIVNNGIIQGAGGPGGPGGVGTSIPTSGSAGTPGGSAVYVNRPVTITNNGTIAGGGGGGRGGPGGGSPDTRYGGGGGGGGAGYSAVGAGGSGAPATGGIFNYPGSPGSPGQRTTGGSGGPPGGQPGGAWGAVGGGAAPTPGGAAGNYIVGNAFVTWPATGTRYGGVA